MPGEPALPLPRVFFGRDQLVDEIVGLAQQLTPVALIGAGGIGKTSIILQVLHDKRTKRRFGQDRRFIRCDQFPASHSHFLRRLSSAIGAGIENPENLSSLQRFLSSKEILIVLDNAESILDPKGPSAQEVYAAVDELARFSNICLCLTSRISIIPRECKIIKVPKLSAEAAQNTFYRIHGHDERSNSINDILEQRDNHPLSITLLATVAPQNQWDANRLVAEWDKQRTGMLHPQHSQSLATAIDLSLASPMFQELGPDARPLLEVVAFLPQGVNEKRIHRLFPTIPNAQSMLDGFCILSLAYRNSGFITMLAPLRDHLRPKTPSLSPLLVAAKENYFTRLSGEILPGKPGYEEARWITAEDVNVEHLLDVFTIVNASSESIWDTCAKFMAQLSLHGPRLVTLGPRIEALPDNHPSKPQCLFNLAQLFESVGNSIERKRLLTHALELWGEQGNDFQVARTLADLSDTNWRMGLYEEGIRQGRKASEIFERLGDVVQQAFSLVTLTWLLDDTGKPDAAEEAGLRAIDLLPEKGEEFCVCQAHRALGDMYRYNGKMEKAIYHFEMALGIASSLNAVEELFWVHYGVAWVFLEEGRFTDAQTHIECGKPYAVNNTYRLARAMDQQAWLWDRQGRFGDAKSEALRAIDAFEKLGAANYAEATRDFLRQIEARRPGRPRRFKWRW